MESSTFKALVEKTKARSDKDLIETIWYRTVRKVADFKDDAEDSKRFVTRIEEHVNKIFFYNKATTVKNEDELTFMDKKELLDLWILYVVESDTFDFGKYETERVLKKPLITWAISTRSQCSATKISWRGCLKGPPFGGPEVILWKKNVTSQLLLSQRI